MIEGQFPPYTLSCSKAAVLAIAYEIIQKQNSLVKIRLFLHALFFPLKKKKSFPKMKRQQSDDMKIVFILE